MFDTEVYTYTYNQIFEGITEIDYVQLKDENYHSVNYNQNTPVKDKYGNKSFYYVSKNLQENNITKNINSLFLFTLKTDKGTIIFLSSPDVSYYNFGEKYFTKPVYTSGFYLGKDIQIIIEIFNDASQTRQISVVFL